MTKHDPTTIEQRTEAFIEALASEGIRAAVCVVVIGKDDDGDDACMAHTPVFHATELEGLGVAEQRRAQADFIFEQSVGVPFNADADRIARDEVGL